MFFVVKFDSITPRPNNQQYLTIIIIANALLLLHFYVFSDTHTAFDEFTQTIMHTYHSEHTH